VGSGVRLGVLGMILVGVIDAVGVIEGVEVFDGVRVVVCVGQRVSVGRGVLLGIGDGVALEGLVEGEISAGRVDAVGV